MWPPESGAFRERMAAEETTTDDEQAKALGKAAFAAKVAARDRLIDAEAEAEERRRRETEGLTTTTDDNNSLLSLIGK